LRHHEDSPTTPTVDDESCDNVVVAATAVLREDVRRNVSPQDANHAIPVPRYQLAQFTIDTCQNQKAGCRWLLENRPLSTALRI